MEVRVNQTHYSQYWWVFCHYYCCQDKRRDLLLRWADRTTLIYPAFWQPLQYIPNQGVLHMVNLLFSFYRSSTKRYGKQIKTIQYNMYNPSCLSVNYSACRIRVNIDRRPVGIHVNNILGKGSPYSLEKKLFLQAFVAVILRLKGMYVLCPNLRVHCPVMRTIIWFRLSFR